VPLRFPQLLLVGAYDPIRVSNAQWCRRRGCKRTSKSFDLLKIRTKSVKNPENVRKILENLGKLPEKTGKNGAQHNVVSF